MGLVPLDLGAEERIELDLSSYGTPVCGNQGKGSSVCVSPILKNPVEMTSAVCISKDSSNAQVSISKMRNTFSAITEFLTIPTIPSNKGKARLNLVVRVC